MLKDQRDLLLAFNAHNVRYLVVGGYAYSHYTEPRATKDLDVFVDPSPENAASVFAALVDFGAPLAGMTALDFQDGESWFQIGVALSRIDIIQKIDAVDFDAAWKSSELGMASDDIPVRYNLTSRPHPQQACCWSASGSGRRRRPKGRNCGNLQGSRI